MKNTESKNKHFRYFFVCLFFGACYLQQFDISAKSNHMILCFTKTLVHDGLGEGEDVPSP